MWSTLNILSPTSISNPSHHACKQGPTIHRKVSMQMQNRTKCCASTIAVRLGARNSKDRVLSDWILDAIASIVTRVLSLFACIGNYAKTRVFFCHY